jgi:hypothetical protein
MEEIFTLSKSGVEGIRQAGTAFYKSKFTPERSLNNLFKEKLLAEGGESIVNYLCCLGLLNEPYTHILSSKNNYYDCAELRGIKTLVNLKKLNNIVHLDSFLHIVNKAISAKTNFIGCFFDRDTLHPSGSHGKTCKRFMNTLDLEAFKEIGKDDVRELMESHGFTMIDMTEINGITYFITQSKKDRNL